MRVWLGVWLLGGLIAGVGSVAGAAEQVATVTLDEVSVSAAKTERRLDEIPATVTVFDEAELQAQVIENISDLVRYEPGVSVPFQGSRFGRGGFSIRGLGGNRVQIEVDGVPVPDAFAIGDFANAGRDLVDIDSLKRVEIVRGSASSLYGSDALGGVVSFTTKDPADYLDSPQDRLAVRARSGYFSADDSLAVGATLAGAAGDFSGLVSGVIRNGDELDNKARSGGTGPSRTEPDPHQSTSTNLLAKLVYGERGKAPLRLTLDHYLVDSATDAQSAIRQVSASTRTTALNADDQVRRQRLSLDQRYTELGPSWLDSALWRVYLQDSRTRQDTLEARSVTSMGVTSQRERSRRALFDQQVIGGETTLTGSFATGALGHRWVAGAELERTQTKQSRNGSERNLTTGTTTSTVGPDAFPVRDFPISNTIVAGLYAQDDITLGAFTLIPGLRVDHYDLDPKPDDIFTADNPGITPTGLNTTNLSPKLGLIYRFTEDFSAYANYARGFRAPPYDDANVGFTNVQFGYTAIPNPDLKPETSNSYELGLRGRYRQANARIAGFYNQYRNFIESFVSLGVDPDSGLLVFQSQNLTRVRIYGAEFSGEIGGALIAERLSSFTLRSALAYARGDDRSAGVPLNSVDPLTAVLGLGWKPAEWPVSAEFVTTAVAGDHRVDDSAGAAYQASGYVKFDLLGQWQITPRGELNLGLFNLGDNRILPAANVQGRLASDVSVERFTQPGFNVGANLRWRF